MKSPATPYAWITWRTPLGPLRGEAGAAGLHTLRFSSPAERPAGPSATGPVAVEAIVMPSAGDSSADAIHATVMAVTRFLNDYFLVRPEASPPTDLPLDLSGYGDFDRRAWEATRRIPRGQTRTYGELATAIGRPGAARAIGGAMRRNPLVLIVPCHRVLRTGTSPTTPPGRRLGGFSGGLDLKRRLLDLEAALLHNPS